MNYQKKAAGLANSFILRHKNRYSKAFTLVELLVVIAIIGILAAVVLTGLAASRDRARASAALQSVKSAFPMAVDCYARNLSMSNPAANGGNTMTGTVAPVCDGAGNWPALGNSSNPSTTGCVYTTNLTGNRIQFVCTGATSTTTCNCDYATKLNCTCP